MKYAFIKEHTDHYPTSRLCKVLGVSPSGYYDWFNRKPSKQALEREGLLSLIKIIDAEVMSNYGSPRMHFELVDRGHAVSEGRVQRVMHTNDIKAKRARRHKRTYKHRDVIAPVDNVLDRQFCAKGPNEKWVQDITFIENTSGLVVSRDCFRLIFTCHSGMVDE